MLVLGISGAISFPYENIYELSDFYYHDSAAVLVEDGNVIYAIEEERLNRIKHTNKAPLLSMKFCLESHGIKLSQIDAVAVYFQENFLNQVLKYYYLRHMEVNKFLNWRGYIHRMLIESFGEDIDDRKIVFIPHHIAHADSVYLMSGFDESLVLSLDGRGDNGSGIVQSRYGQKTVLLYNFNQSLSLGVFYLDLILYLGYQMFDEYKAMGLAPYGDPAKYRRYMKKCYSLLPDGQYEIKRDFIDFIFSSVIPRRKGGPFTQEHKDIAASLQEALEIIVMHVLEFYKEKTGHDNLCLAGGVAHNCSMNGKILYSGMFEDIFVQPAAHDAGGALGAALHVVNEKSPLNGQSQLMHVYWGSCIGEDHEIYKALKRWESFIYIEKNTNITAITAKLIAEGHVIGWVQGSSEFGPRALGNRSIVADPRPAENKDIINEMIKKREAYRPFAPAVLEEDLDEYYIAPNSVKEFPFMNFVLKTKADKQRLLGAVTHVDGTARVQTVSRKSNLLFWELINEFKQLTGIPILLNTSFNNNAEPIVNSVEDAIICYLTTKLNYLVVGNYLISKKDLCAESYLPLIPKLPLHVVLTQSRKYTSFEHTELIHEICVNYSQAYNINISSEMYKLLNDIDGKQSLGDLFKKHGYEADDIKGLIDELLVLWAKRVVILDL